MHYDFAFFSRCRRFCAARRQRLTDSFGARVTLCARRLVALALVATLTCTNLVVAAAQTTFPDVSSRSPYATAINFLVADGVLSGYPDGTFRPDQSVNRAEALKIIFLANHFPTPTAGGDVFGDVTADAWFAPFVAAAKTRGVVAGYPDGSFHPEQTVNLVEALKMLLRAADLPLANYATATAVYADTEDGAWYTPFLAYARIFTLVDANDADRIAPAALLTRGRLADILYRFVRRVDQTCPALLADAERLSTTYFTDITLDTALQKTFVEDEVATVTGTVKDASAVTAFYVDSSGAQTPFRGTVSGSAFTIPIAFHLPGSYQLTIIPGTSGRNYASTVTVAPRECAPAITTAAAPPAPTPPTAAIADNRVTFRWSLADANLTQFTVRQNDHVYTRLLSRGATSFTPEPTDFADFTIGSATIEMVTAKSATGATNVPRTAWSASTTTTINLTQHHYAERSDNLTLDTALPATKSGTSLTLVGSASVDLESSAYYIAPDGLAREVVLTTVSDTITAGTHFTATFPTAETGAYILELNNTAGIAVLNYPLYEPGTIPLVPDFLDLRGTLTPPKTLTLPREQSVWLKLVNTERARYHLAELSLDDQLTTLAQSYADRMARDDFFGHVDPSGGTPDSRRIAVGFPLPVGENLAKDIATTSAHEGLMRSAAHRANLLNPDWTRVGLGVALTADNYLIFVQEFSSEALTAANLPATKTRFLTLLNDARTDAGTTTFAADTTLDMVAQTWSEMMVRDDFFGFAHGSTSLESAIRAAGFRGAFSTFVVSAGDVPSLVASLLGQDAAKLTKTRLSIGLAQDANGMYRTTVVAW